jgi:NAD(P)-dependent dehydrogenase (short-subunit alcohol dehydrogenase family)
MGGIALITGSGRGIGAATAKLAARRGYAVCINYLGKEERARAVADEIRAGGGRAILVQGRYRRRRRRDADVRRGRPAVRAHHLRRHHRQGGPPRELRRGRDARVIEVNVVGTMLCTREAAKRMSTRTAATAAPSSISPRSLQ